MVKMEEIDMQDTQRDLMNVMYGTGFDDGVKVGKTEILHDLMKTTLEWKASSSVVSCDTIMQLLKQRMESIGNN